VHEEERKKLILLTS